MVQCNSKYTFWGKYKSWHGLGITEYYVQHSPQTSASPACEWSRAVRLNNVALISAVLSSAISSLFGKSMTSGWRLYAAAQIERPYSPLRCDGVGSLWLICKGSPQIPFLCGVISVDHSSLVSHKRWETPAGRSPTYPLHSQHLGEAQLAGVPSLVIRGTGITLNLNTGSLGKDEFHLLQGNIFKYSENSFYPIFNLPLDNDL